MNIVCVCVCVLDVWQGRLRDTIFFLKKMISWLSTKLYDKYYVKTDISESKSAQVFLNNRPACSLISAHIAFWRSAYARCPGVMSGYEDCHESHCL
jgi:hypothetical protein